MNCTENLDALIERLNQVFNLIKPLLVSGDPAIDGPFLQELETLNEAQNDFIRYHWGHMQMQLEAAKTEYFDSLNLATIGYIKRTENGLDEFVKAHANGTSVNQKWLDTERKSMSDQLSRKMTDADTWFDLKVAAVESRFRSEFDAVFLGVHESAMKIVSRYEDAMNGSNKN